MFNNSFSLTTEQGNYWSNWDYSGYYSIDTSWTFDLYPQILNDINNDGLYDTTEIIDTHTYPFNTDTDADSMPDGWEVDNNLDPLMDDADEDSDNDGLTNLEEYNYNTDPSNLDTDGDGYSDCWEIQNGSDPLNADSYLGKFGLSTRAIFGVVVLLVLGFFIFKKFIVGR